MKKIFLGLFLAVLILGSNLALANHIEQPNFPKTPNPETDLISKMDDFNCGSLYIFEYEFSAGKFWKFYYLGDNFSHKPITVVFTDETTEKVKVWVDRDRDGHFDEIFDDGGAVFQKYSTPCVLVGISA